MLAVGHRSEGTFFYDTVTLEQVGSLETVPWKIAYRPDGRQLALVVDTPSLAGTRTFDPRPVRLVDPVTFEEQSVQLGGFLDGQVEAWDLANSGDGRFLAASQDVYDDGGGFTSSVLVWDVLAPEQPIRTIHPGPLWALALSPDGGRLYVGTHEPSVRVYDTASGRIIGSIGLPNALLLGSTGADDAAEAFELSPDGATLAVQDAEDVVILDTATLTEQRRLQGHTGVVRSLGFSPDGTLLVSGSDDRTAIVWNVSDWSQREVLRGHDGAVVRLVFGADGTTVYAPGAPGLLVWDIEGDRRFVNRVEAFGQGGLAAFALPSPVGDAVVHLSNAWENNDGGTTIEVYDVASGQVGAQIELDHGAFSPEWRPPLAEQTAFAHPDGIVSVWDWRRGEVIAERKITDGAIAGAGLVYSADGERTVIGERSGAVVQVDADTLEPVSSEVDVGEEIGVIAVGADGKTAVATLRSGGYAIVDFVDGGVNKFDLTITPSSAALSPDGERLVVGASTGDIGLIDLDSGEWLRPPIEGLTTARIYRISFTPDGSTFASSDWDGRVRLWDGQSGELLATFLAVTEGGGTVAEFLDDGHTVVITNVDGSVYTWDTRIDRWIEFACGVAGRNLTEDEWHETFGERPHRDTCPTA